MSNTYWSCEVLPTVGTMVVTAWFTLILSGVAGIPTSVISCGTEGRNRTGTPVKEPDFESQTQQPSWMKSPAYQQYSPVQLTVLVQFTNMTAGSCPNMAQITPPYFSGYWSPDASWCPSALFSFWPLHHPWSITTIAPQPPPYIHHWPLPILTVVMGLVGHYSFIATAGL